MKKEQDTAAYKLFHKKFYCTVPNMYLYSAEAAKQVWMPSTGSAELDQSMIMQPCTMYITAVGMVMYYQQGAPVNLCNYKDSAEIYRLINEHIHDWRETIAYDINRTDAPLEDLHAMEEFAIELYRKAKYQMEKAPEYGAIAEFKALFADPTGLKVALPQEKVTLPKEHQPIVLNIAKQQLRRRGYNVT